MPSIQETENKVNRREMRIVVGQMLQRSFAEVLSAPLPARLRELLDLLQVEQPGNTD
jgi:hypothetical protein